MKKAKKWKLFLLYPIVVIIALILIIIAYKLNQSTVSFTENGIYQTLQVPVKSKFIDFNINLAGAGDNPTFDPAFIEGPFVTYKKNNTLSVDWYQGGEAYHKTYDIDTKSFMISSKNKTHNFTMPEIKKPVTEIAAIPDKIAFISDIHGDYEYMDTLLKNLQVIDSLGNWNFKNNHLVIAGDMVDRGNEVTKVLWKIVKLSKEAEQAGGMIHYLIGNHEQYILKGNFSRVDSANLYAIQQMMPFKDAFSDKTYLGKWLRTRAVVIKIGNTIITHGGISPKTVAKKFTLQQINQGMWDYWDDKPVDKDLKEAILGKTGVTQYRGYIMQNNEIQKASNEDIDSILKFYDASHIIVGHTNVPSIEPLFDGKVYDINAIETSPQALIFDNENPKIIDVGVIKEDNTHKMNQRDFSFFKTNDWKMVFLTVRNIIKLSSINHHY